MATLSRGQTFGSTETISNTKLHNLVDLGGVSNIVDADISVSANIADTKIADITTGNKVRGSALGNLASIPSGAGLIPFANIGNLGLSIASIPNLSITPITIASWVDGAAMRNIQSMPSLAGQLAWYSIVSSLASGATTIFDGVSKFVGKAYTSSNIQIFTSSGTFTAPAGVTRVYLSMVGGGGGAYGSTAGGGGCGGNWILNYPFTVTPGNNYTVTIGAGGLGRINGSRSATDGGSTSFDTVSVSGGKASSGTGATTQTGGGLNASTSTPGYFQQLGGNGGASPGAGGGTPFGSGGTPVTNGSPSIGVSGEANTGAGGGAGTGTGAAQGGDGGSGVCIVMY